jgi:hypothetical protein
MSTQLYLQEIAKIIPPESSADLARKRLKELAQASVLKNVTDPISVDWKLST